MKFPKDSWACVFSGHTLQVVGIFAGDWADVWCPSCGDISAAPVAKLHGSALRLAEALLAEKTK